MWKNTSKKVYKIFCPTEETLNTLIDLKIFDREKIFLLHDPIFSTKDLIKSKKDSELDNRFEKNNIILVGRLTKQKNFDLIIEAYKENKIYQKDLKFLFLVMENLKMN